MKINQSIRIIFRNKTYSLLNIAGLAVGIACAILILLWVEDEATYNDFPKKKQLYALYQNQVYSGEIYTIMIAPNPLAAVLNEETPGIKNVTRYRSNNKSLFTLNDKMLYETGSYADSSIFGMLDIEFLQGDATTAFDAAYPLIITEDMALKFFGTDNPIGQTLKKDNGQEYEVTAVVKNPKSNSDFRFSWLIPFQQLVKERIANGWQEAETAWGTNWMSCYVELDKSADVNRINSQIKDLLKQKKNDPDEPATLFLYPVAKLKLYGEFKDGYPTGTGYVRYVRLFFLIAVVILIIACINFMNLSTARSQKRVLEVGVRKTFGAKRFRLVRQFMSESGIITLLALLIALMLVAVVLPQFNILVGKQLTPGLNNPVRWLGLLGIGVISCLAAGSYPAFFLSSFPPIDVLRKLKTKSGAGVVRLREGLVVFQFAVSLTLIICATFVYMQVQHTKNRSLGMDVEQVIMAEANRDIWEHFEPLKQELAATGVVENVGLSSQTMLNMSTNMGNWNWRGKPDNVDPLVFNTHVTDGLFETLQITLFDGRNFNRSIDANNPNIIINKTFADLMGEEGHVGGQIENSGQSATIIGIINDYVFNDIYSTAQRPTIFLLGEEGRNLFIRLKPGNIQTALQKVEAVMKQISPNHPFEYRFMDEQFNTMFKSTLLVGKLAGLFAGLAIFISCLGLFGLTAFAAEQRTREIGIRKVLGASVLNIVELLGRNFMVLIGISFVIAIPLAWWIISEWLQNYEYRIGISWRVFAGCGLLVIIIALLTVGWQAIKAATANPVKAISSSE
ncbi:MAG: ABC transporter permease [Tannerella sp.]|nr:ABC transporter permease [Tannerella sp.]